LQRPALEPTEKSANAAAVDIGDIIAAYPIQIEEA
jgi:hypothetical protein